ncbi:MAG TPA: hypothetical protein VKF42_02275 [Chitinivibrionales bacterium]|jgi:hypothetical protein|nr:hypothetical protein [Chitinivibrionales bacterium]
MILAVVGILLLLLALLLAVRIGMKREKPEEEVPSPMIHGSGIFSIIRRSPRENIGDYKPSQEEIRKYLIDKNVNMSFGGPEKLIAAWNDQMEANIREIEQGDKEGTEFYYFDFKWDDPVCSKIIHKGRFVTREQIFQYPQVIPPFHLGCGCQLCKYQGKDKLRETTEIGMLPLFRSGEIVPLPEWKEITRIETPFSTSHRPDH